MNILSTLQKECLIFFFYCHNTFPLQHIHIEISVYGVCPFTAIVLRRQNLLAAPAILYKKPRGRRTSQKEKTLAFFQMHHTKNTDALPYLKY